MEVNQLLLLINSDAIQIESTIPDGLPHACFWDEPDNCSSVFVYNF